MMAKKKIVFDLDEHRTKIRYKRASLTVEQTVRVIITPVEEALAAHRPGAVSAEEVAEAFLREQIVAHSPSFDWEQADLNVLLERVAAAVNDPKLKARTPSELVPELEAVEAKEREKWTELSKGMRQQFAPLAKDLQKKMQQAYPPLLTEKMQKMMREQLQTISGSLVDNSALRKAMEGNLVNLHGGLSSIPTSLLPTVGLIEPGLDPSLFDELRQGILNAQSSQLLTTNFDQLIEQAIRAARDGDTRELANAVGTDVEQRGERISDADVKELIDRLSEIAKALQEQVGGHPFAMAIAASVIASLIVYVIQYVLAVKYGITPTPPEKSTP
jgi:hypothetical protein